MQYHSVILALLLVCGNCYFEDNDHRAVFANLLEDFTTNFKERFNVIAFGQMEWHSKLELAFGYWVTSIRVRGLRESTITYDLDIDGLVVKVPELTIELWIEEQYTVPIKLTNFEFTVLLVTNPNKLGCTGVQIDYDDLSLDIGTVIEYITRQVLSLDSIKKAIKASEIPIRNFFAQAFHYNWERIKPLIKSIRTVKSTDTSLWLTFITTSVKGIEVKDDEFWVQTRTLYNLESQRKTEKTTDL